MRDAYIPYGAYWSTPFVRWQGSLSHLHPLEFAAHVARRELARRDIDPAVFDYGILGITIPSPSCFFGLPWVTAMIGAPHVGGPTVNHACATSARVLQMASQEIRSENADCALLITADKCSNGPHLYFPYPGGPGGTGAHEDWVLDNFSNDPYAKCAMVVTAENVARQFGITTAEQHDVALLRYSQYQEACADDHAFHRRYMTLPFEVPDARFGKTIKSLAGDEGIHPTSAAGLAALKPVVEGGTVTFGAQTHPADGNAGLVVTTRGKAREISGNPAIEVRLLGFGLARADKAHMPYAPVPAAKRALKHAGLSMQDIDCVKSHNPFAVNDIVFSRETGFDWNKMNNYGCSLVWGHPQGPTGMRAVIEMIEELAIRGGGKGLFHGCAAGDSAMAVILEVRDGK
ncbi:MAG: thiolase family protein [Betaproteobacteria bacterium]|nr:thiolase family protein [Betaproteobacteria bacterium]